MKRLPHAAHSPVRFPFSSVVNERGAPHWRQGRERGAPPSGSSRRPGRPYRSLRSGGRRGDSLPSGMNVVVVSHSAHATWSFPSSRAVTVRIPPQSAHSGPGVGDAAVSPAAGASPAPGAAVPIGSVPSTRVVTRWHSGHVPVSTRASCTV